MNFFKLYIGDYQRDTGMLSLAEHGAYLLMLQHHYATERPLPKGRELYRLLRCETKSDRDAVDTVVSRFWQETDAGLINERAMQEFDRATEIAETNRSIALAREAKKRAVREHEQSTNRAKTVTRNEHGQSTNQTPDTRHQTKTFGTNPPPTEPDTSRAGGVSPGELTKPMVKAGIRCNPGHPDIIALAQAGCTPETVAAAIAEAKLTKPSPPQGYVVAILKRWQSEPTASAGNAPRAPPTGAAASKQAHRDSYDAQARAAQEGIFGNERRAEIDITASVERIA